MQLKPTVAAALLLPLALLGREARAQDQEQRVDVHGYYYKETSTRVVQPRVEVSAVVPETRGTQVSAFYLLDAITSASIASGASRDSALTEFRNEVGASVLQPVGPGRFGLAYSRSRESDYDSDTIGATASIDLFEKNTTWTLGYAHTFDSVFNRGRRVEEGDLNTNVLSLYVSQLLSPLTVGSLGFEWAGAEGYQQNPYRGVNVGGAVLAEVNPPSRNRYTFAGRIAQLLPATGTTLQLFYRFYYDSWQLPANTLELRIYQDLGHFADLRLSYRYYRQGDTYFAKSSYNITMDPFYSGDPKLFAFDSHYGEVQLRFPLESLAGKPFVGWFAAGTLDFTYGFLYMGSRFGNCGPLDPNTLCQDRVVSLGMTLPF